MTDLREKSPKIPSRPHYSAGQLAFAAVSVFSLTLILRNSEIAIRQMARGLSLCVTTVIPSLFPFMILSELIVASGTANVVGRLLAKPFRWLFGISGDGGCAILLGFFCGFPVGTRCALSLYDSGRIDEKELSFLLSFCNTPSSAFLVNAVGISLFGDRSLGLLLYCVTLLSAALTGIVGSHLMGVRKRAAKPSPSSHTNASRPNGISVFTDAVGSSALAMLRICAFVVFFSAFLGTLEHLVEGLALPQTLGALLVSFFEMTAGVSRAAACPSPLGESIAAFAVGFSGLSVCFQMIGLCEDRPVSFRPYLFAKLFQGLLCALLLSLLRA